MSQGKQPFIQQKDEWDMNRAWQLAEHWQADRRAGEQADWRPDEQAHPSGANYCIAPLYDETPGQKAALRSAARMGGGVCGRRGLGRCRREEEGEEKR